MLEQIKLQFEKPNSKKDKRQKQADRLKRRHENSELTKHLDKYKCSNILCLTRHSSLDCCHIIPKRPNAPHLDIPENSIALCRNCHRTFDGQTTEWGMSQIDFRVSVLKQHRSDPEFRHKQAMSYLAGNISKAEFESYLKETYETKYRNS